MLHDTGAFVPWGIIVPYIAATTFPGPYVVPAYRIEVSGGVHQSGADHRGARRRAAAGGVRHGAADGPRRARTQPRPRRGARPQHDPARADALFGRARFPRRQATGLRQRRFSQEARPARSRSPATTAFAPARRRRAPKAAISASASATMSRAPGSARSRASPFASCRTARSRSRPARRRRGKAPAPRSRRSSPTTSAAASRTS